jgi:hypothetical protein
MKSGRGSRAHELWEKRALCAKARRVVFAQELDEVSHFHVHVAQLALYEPSGVRLQEGPPRINIKTDPTFKG